MTLHISREMLAAAYGYLVCQKPFAGWKLPPSDEVKFGVIKRKDRFAHYQMRAGKHHIEFCHDSFVRHENLISTMAHEIIHLYAENNGIASAYSHGKGFQRLADRVCKIHGFDRTTF